MMMTCLIFVQGQAVAANGTRDVPIAAVIFDHGGVVVGDSWFYDALTLSDITQVPLFTLTSTAQSELASLELGTEEPGKALARYTAVHGGRLAADWEQRLADSYSQHAAVRPQMFALARCLQSMGYITPLFSNTIAIHAEVNRQRGAFGPFSPLFLSHEMHLAKPDPASFAYVARALGIAPESCVFIDDRAINVEAAQQSGMHAILFTDLTQLKAQLAQLGVEAYCSVRASGN
jgi:FMN phosphatase YigB (HAD superfamily)